MMNRLRELADRLEKPLLNKNLDFVPLNHFAVVTDEDIRLVLCKDSRRLPVNHNLIIIDDPLSPYTYDWHEKWTTFWIFFTTRRLEQL